MTPTEHNSHLAGDLNAPRPQRSLLAQARLTNADYERIVDPMMDVLEEEGTQALNAGEPVDIRSVIRAAADAATRKAFEALEAWLRERADNAILRPFHEQALKEAADELHAQLQAQAEARE